MSTENTATPQQNNPPILWANRDRDGKTNGVTLWVNDRAGDNEKAPQMTGWLIEGETKTPVSVWVHAGSNGNFVSMAERNVKNADGSYSNKKLGNGNAVNTEGKNEDGTPKPLAADRIPYMLFNVGGKTFRANCNPGALEFMEDLGFKNEVIENYTKKIEEQPRRNAASAPKP